MKNVIVLLLWDQQFQMCSNLIRDFIPNSLSYSRSSNDYLTFREYHNLQGYVAIIKKKKNCKQYSRQFSRNKIFICANIYIFLLFWQSLRYFCFMNKWERYSLGVAVCSATFYPNNKRMNYVYTQRSPISRGGGESLILPYFPGSVAILQNSPYLTWVLLTFLIIVA